MQSPYVLGKYPIIDHLYNDFVQEACTEIQLPGSGTIRTRKSTEMHCLPGFLLSVDFPSRWDNGHSKCTNSCDPTTGISGIRTALRPSRSQLDFRSTNFWRKKSCTTFFCRILVWIHSWKSCMHVHNFHSSQLCHATTAAPPLPFRSWPIAKNLALHASMNACTKCTRAKQPAEFL